MKPTKSDPTNPAQIAPLENRGRRSQKKTPKDISWWLVLDLHMSTRSTCLSGRALHIQHWYSTKIASGLLFLLIHRHYSMNCTKTLLLNAAIQVSHSFGERGTIHKGYKQHQDQTPFSDEKHFSDNWPSTSPGWWFQPLWKILITWDDDSQYMEK